MDVTFTGIIKIVIVCVAEKKREKDERCTFAHIIIY